MRDAAPISMEDAERCPAAPNGLVFHLCLSRPRLRTLVPTRVPTSVSPGHKLRRFLLRRAALTRGGEEVGMVVMLRLVQRRVRVGRQEGRGWHQGVPIVQEGDAGGQGARKVLGGHLPQGFGLVQQNILDEEGGGPGCRDGVHRRGEVEVHFGCPHLGQRGKQRAGLSAG